MKICRTKNSIWQCVTQLKSITQACSPTLRSYFSRWGKLDKGYTKTTHFKHYQTCSNDLGFRGTEINYRKCSFVFSLWNVTQVSPSGITQREPRMLVILDIWVILMSQKRQLNNECPASNKFACFSPTGCGRGDWETSREGCKESGSDPLPLVQSRAGIHCSDVTRS